MKTGIDVCTFFLLQVFNIHGDEGIGRAELTTMLSAIQQSTNTILSSVSDSDDAVMYGENREQAVKRMVDAAFKNCDITRTGKLLPLVSLTHTHTIRLKRKEVGRGPGVLSDISYRMWRATVHQECHNGMAQCIWTAIQFRCTSNFW